MSTLSRYLFAIGCGAFVILGVNASILGPALLTLSRNTGTPIGALGIMFTAMSAGYIVSAPIIATLGARLSLRALLVAPGLMLISMSMMAFGTQLWLVMLGAFLLGFAQSSAQVGYTTLLSSSARGAAGSARINRLNSFYGVGALLGPAVVAASYRLLDSAVAAFVLAAALSILMFAVGLRLPIDGEQRSSMTNAATTDSARTLLGSPIMLTMCITMGIYVGAEIAFSGWTTEFTQRRANVDVSLAALSASMFYGMLAFSRYFAGVALRRISPPVFVSVLIGLAVFGIVLMLLPVQSYPLALLGAALTGLGFGPIYPTLVSIGIDRYPNSARLVSSLLTSAGSVGAVTLPMVTGWVLATGDGLQNAWLMLLGTLALMLAVWTYTRRQLGRA
jgi:MFS transporter, FHS family, glucose/mannose:H+ symporter